MTTFLTCILLCQKIKNSDILTWKSEAFVSQSINVERIVTLLNKKLSNPITDSQKKIVQDIKSTRTFLDINPEILITKADKGNPIVAMYRNDYGWPWIKVYSLSPLSASFLIQICRRHYNGGPSLIHAIAYNSIFFFDLLISREKNWEVISLVEDWVIPFLLLSISVYLDSIFVISIFLFLSFHVCILYFFLRRPSFTRHHCWCIQKFLVTVSLCHGPANL